MMALGNDLLLDFNNTVCSYGEIVRLRFYTQSFGAGSYYDDDTSLSVSGQNIWTSGMVFPVGNPSKGSREALLLEQGKLLADDSVVYICGSIPSSGAAVKVGLGSPVDEEYQIIWPGVESQQVNGVSVYKALYIRFLPNGSFVGE